MSFEGWYRSSTCFYALVPMFQASACVLLVLAGLLVAVLEGHVQQSSVALFVCAIFAGILYWVTRLRIAIVHVKGEQIVIHQRSSEFNIGWDEVESVSRRTTTGVGAPYLFKLQIRGRKRAFYFIEPFNMGWHRQFDGGVDWDYLATTDRCDWNFGD